MTTRTQKRLDQKIKTFTETMAQANKTLRQRFNESAKINDPGQKYLSLYVLENLAQQEKNEIVEALLENKGLTRLYNAQIISGVVMVAAALTSSMGMASGHIANGDIHLCDSVAEYVFNGGLGLGVASFASTIWTAKIDNKRNAACMEDPHVKQLLKEFNDGIADITAVRAALTQQPDFFTSPLFNELVAEIPELKNISAPKPKGPK